MNEEIKEDVSDLMELLETTSKKEFYRLTIDHELVVRLYNYITNLQQENQKYKEVIDKAIKFIEDTYYSKNTTDIDNIVFSSDKLIKLREILKYSNN